MPQISHPWLPFLLLPAASNTFQALLKRAFCRRRTSEEVRLPFEPKSIWQTESGFVEHMRPLQVGIVFANDYIAIRSTNFGPNTNTGKPIVII